MGEEEEYCSNKGNRKVAVEGVGRERERKKYRKGGATPLIVWTRDSSVEGAKGKERPSTQKSQEIADT